jgi:hypothetical protein
MTLSPQGQRPCLEDTAAASSTTTSALKRRIRPRNDGPASRLLWLHQEWRRRIKHNDALPALIRITVSDVDNLDKQAFVPFDKLPGVTHWVGTVTSIEETASEQGGSIVLADGEHISYAALLLTTGST